MKRKKGNQREKQSSTKKKKAMIMSEPVVIDLDLDLDSPPDKNKGTPLRSVLCVKSDLNMREIEEREDCFILDFDLCGDDNVVKKGFDDEDVSVIREQGKVACRDYPHSRHLCVKNNFEKTPHQSFCELCYCFVCDTAAPCTFWTGESGHCHAIDNEAWKYLRKRNRKQ